MCIMCAQSSARATVWGSEDESQFNSASHGVISGLWLSVFSRETDGLEFI